MNQHLGFRVLLVSAIAIIGVVGAAVSPVGAKGQPVNTDGDQVSCTHFTGTWTFNPGLTNAGGGSDQVTEKGKFSGCTASGSGAVKIHRGTLSGSGIYQSTHCSDFESVHFPVPVSIAWKTKPKMTSPQSAFEFQAAVAVSPNVTVGNEGSTVVSGAFQGGDSGASSAIQLNSTLSDSGFQAACSSTNRLTTLKFTSGTVTLG
jgi:hypothetical protein